MLKINIAQQLGERQFNVDVEIPASGITAIFGVSCAGKTSLINVICGLTQPQSGQIALNDRLLFDGGSGTNLSPEKRRIGYVFQDAPRLFPHYHYRACARQPAVWHGNQNEGAVRVAGDAAGSLSGLAVGWRWAGRC